MTRALQHRGPDAEGYWLAENCGVAFGHRRLAILDLSETGFQPMTSASGRFVIALNGEIYNYLELKSRYFSGVGFRGTSDTEVLLELIEKIGLKRALQEIRGMFAFALWDNNNHELSLARDRFGEKPIYYGTNKQDLIVFGSELKALRSHSGYRRQLNFEALSEYLKYGYVPSPLCIDQGIQKLLPGHFITLSSSNQQLPASEAYYSLSDVLAAGSRSMEISEMHSLLKDSVRGQMHADVPLGAFLSGGIDSSLIVALMQEQSSKPVQTFSVGFAEAEFNELADAKRVANHLRTDHHEFLLSSKDALEMAPLMPSMFDEPFADSSQIPTYLVAKMARKKVTVSLSGDAGDEVFGGYNRYFIAAEKWPKIEKIPLVLRQLLAKTAHSISTKKSLPLFFNLLPQHLKLSNPSLKLQKIANSLTAKNKHELYMGFVQLNYSSKGTCALNSAESLFASLDSGPLKNLSFAEKMMLTDTLTYLPDDILTKVDRAAMSVGLETRVPFLDHRVVEAAWTFAATMKFKNGRGKVILREILRSYFPSEFFDRPKAGFALPLAEWLRGPLRPWVEDLLSDHSLQAKGYLDAKQIKKLWNEHLSGRVNRQAEIWMALMLQGSL